MRSNERFAIFQRRPAALRGSVGATDRPRDGQQRLRWDPEHDGSEPELGKCRAQTHPVGHMVLHRHRSAKGSWGLCPHPSAGCGGFSITSTALRFAFRRKIKQSCLQKVLIRETSGVSTSPPKGSGVLGGTRGGGGGGMDGEARFGVLPGQGHQEGPSSAPESVPAPGSVRWDGWGKDGPRPLGAGDTGC